MTETRYPLTFSQGLLHQSVKEFKTAQVLTIGVCVTLKTRLDFSLLRKCILEECERQQCLRIHFTAPDCGGNIMQYMVPQLSLYIPYMDFQDMEPPLIKETMTQWSSQGFDDPESPLCRFTMVSLPNGYEGLYLCIDHRIMDSSGLIFMLNDLFGLYCHYRFRAPAPPMPHPYEDVLKKDLEREENQKSFERDTLFWNHLLASGEPVYTDPSDTDKLKHCRSDLGSPSLRCVPRTISPAAGEMETFLLDKKSSLLLRDFCKKSSVSMTNLLLMGMRTCLSQINNGEPNISLNNYVSRRSLTFQRSCGGCRIHCYPCHTIIPADTSFLAGVQQIKRHQNNIYRHSNFDPLLIGKIRTKLYHTPPLFTYEGAALTYQPLLAASKNPILRHLPLKINWFSSRADIQKLYLTVMEDPSSKGLSFYFKYQTAQLSPTDIEDFYEKLTKILHFGVSHPEAHIKDMEV